MLGIDKAVLDGCSRLQDGLDQVGHQGLVVGMGSVRLIVILTVKI